MMKQRLLVTVVDDDESVRESLPDLLRELGYDAKTFSSGEEFLAAAGALDTQCLILDIAMPGLSGPELKRELDRRAWKRPVIFITAQRDEGLRSRLLAAGATDCLFKPFSDVALQRALDRALKG